MSPLVAIAGLARRESRMHIRTIQKDHRAWSERLWGEPLSRPSHQPILGLTEEVGELAKAHLKSEEGLRSVSKVEYREAKIDAVGDIFLFLCDYCSCENIDLEVAVGRVWEKVSKRTPETEAKRGLK